MGLYWLHTEDGTASSAYDFDQADTRIVIGLSATTPTQYSIPFCDPGATRYVLQVAITSSTTTSDVIVSAAPLPVDVSVAASSTRNALYTARLYGQNPTAFLGRYDMPVFGCTSYFAIELIAGTGAANINSWGIEIAL
jgi:hypothetical protein